MKLVSLLSLAALVCSGAVAQQQPGQSAGIAITAPALGVSCFHSIRIPRCGSCIMHDSKLIFAYQKTVWTAGKTEVVSW